MPARDLSEKEHALVEAARRLAAEEKRPAAASPEDARRTPAPASSARTDRPSARGAAATVLAGAARAGVSVAPGTPLDQPTVVGWDHPAASRVASDRERWARVGELLKAERMAEEARRERLRRNGLGAIAALLLILLVAVLATLLPGASR